MQDKPPYVCHYFKISCSPPLPSCRKGSSMQKASPLRRCCRNMAACDEEGPISFSLQVFLTQPGSLACRKAPRRVVLARLRARGAAVGMGSRSQRTPHPAPAAAGRRSPCTRRCVKGCLKVGRTCKELPFSPSIHLAAFLKAPKKTVLQ